MPSYAAEIKGIAGSGVLINKLPGESLVRKLQAWEPGSILEKPRWGLEWALQCAPQVIVSCHSARSIVARVVL
jgi:hypothetical protein